jgi:O-methyltransferase
MESWAEREARGLAPILHKIEPLTTTPPDALIDLARLVRAVLRFNVPGDFVECGSYAGGAGFLMAHLLREAGIRDRKVWLFDSFEGLPPPQEIDGAAAQDYAAHSNDPENYDNCRASFEEVRRTAKKLGLTGYTECIKGWFEETLPAHRKRIGPIAILRLDGNWYTSIRCCLDNLYDQVVDDGFVICHTYYTYDGCAAAVHEFLGQRRLPYRIESVVGVRPGAYTEDYQSALFCKGQTSWKWLRQVYVTTQEIESVVPPGETLILVDQEELGIMLGGGRRALPFLERDGEYDGPPEEDATALKELNRLRRSGARFLAFAWPAFWWFEHYADFDRHLRARFPCILKNERLVVFDMRS